MVTCLWVPCPYSPSSSRQRSFASRPVKNPAGSPFGWLRPVVPLRCASGGRRGTARLRRALGLSTVRAKPKPNPFGTTRADTSRPATLRSAAFLLSPSVPDVLFRCAWSEQQNANPAVERKKNVNKQQQQQKQQQRQNHERLGTHSRQCRRSG